MEMKTLFSVPVGISNHKEIIPELREFVDQTKDLFNNVDNQLAFQTTLRGYNKKQATVIPDTPEVRRIKEVIIEEVKEFCTQFGYNTEIYEFEVSNLWANSMVIGSTHKTHSHYGHVFSGCCYVQIPENSGFIKFYSPVAVNKAEVYVKEYIPHNSSAWTLGVTDGDIVVWESYLSHEVPTTDYNGVRVTVAFDVDVYFKED